MKKNLPDAPIPDGEIPQRILGAIGLARRAGKLLVGSEIVIDAMRRGTGKLVCVASDASAGTVKKLRDTAAFHRVPYLTLETDMASLAAMLGKKGNTASVLITEEGFVRIIRRYRTIDTDTITEV